MKQRSLLLIGPGRITQNVPWGQIESQIEGKVQTERQDLDHILLLESEDRVP